MRPVKIGQTSSRTSWWKSFSENLICVSIFSWAPGFTFRFSRPETHIFRVANLREKYTKDSRQIICLLFFVLLFSDSVSRKRCLYFLNRWSWDNGNHKDLTTESWKKSSSGCPWFNQLFGHFCGIVWDYFTNVIENMIFFQEKKHAIVKNIPEVNAILWQVKHLIKIIPLKFPKNLPENPNPLHFTIKVSLQWT